MKCSFGEKQTDRLSHALLELLLRSLKLHEVLSWNFGGQRVLLSERCWNVKEYCLHGMNVMLLLGWALE